MIKIFKFQTHLAVNKLTIWVVFFDCHLCTSTCNTLHVDNSALLILLARFCLAYSGRDRCFRPKLTCPLRRQSAGRICRRTPSRCFRRRKCKRTRPDSGTPLRERKMRLPETCCEEAPSSGIADEYSNTFTAQN